VANAASQACKQPVCFMRSHETSASNVNDSVKTLISIAENRKLCQVSPKFETLDSINFSNI